MPRSLLILLFHRGRTVRELDFTEQSPALKAGDFQAYDFFGDGSFYILNAPGHTTGHISGLVRTTANPDTFIFMGGDLCHHGGEIRPSTHLPIPAEVQFTLPESIRSRVPVCPGGAIFQQLNIKRGRKADEPFFDPASADDMEQALKTIKDAQAADAQSDVYFIYAHDMGILDTVDFFPKSANNWKEKGWKEKTLWSFLAELTLGALSAE
jgi:glyoxylase-like metal-dependent hydrolase (beta-lactamase superfamily II)